MMTTGNPIPLGESAGSSAWSTRSSQGDLLDAAIAFARASRREEAAAAHPRRKREARGRPRGVLRAGARAGGEGIEGLSGAARDRRVRRGRGDASRSTKAASSSASSSSSWSPDPSRRRCATCSSPSASLQDPRRARGHAGARDRSRRRDRRRHHGRRHRDELRQRRHPGRRSLETKQEALDRGLGIIRKNYAATVEKGRLDAGRDGQAHGPASTARPAYDDVADADLVIEAVFEDMDVKQEVFRKLDAVVKPGAILATNTSTLDVDQIAGVHQAPAGRGRHALLQPGQRDEAARSGARQEDRARTCWRP